ncbi:MAG: serine/threonine protein kinase [Pseudomonadales bacterium]|nr:serine/threonine protein kinase [Pseudomonadales bacterium]
MASQIPGYQVVRKIGDGGMSTVYLAIQFSIGREVALKVLSPELREDPNFAEKFYREAKIVGTLSHPNVISIYDIGQYQQHYYMAMDYLPGASCSDLAKNQRIPVAKTLQIVKDIAAALAYVHKQGYLHCDIKPDNILFRADGSAVLTDFGISRDLSDKSSDHIISGTPHYMSPEQAQGEHLGPGSDIYSLGVLLYELLTGKLPYTGADAIAVAIKHVSAPVPSLPIEFKKLQPLINKMMHKRASSRFHHADEVIEAINYIGAEYLDQEAIDLPFGLKLSFAGEKIKAVLSDLSGINQRLQFSPKHGLIFKCPFDDIELPDIEKLEQVMRQTTQYEPAGTAGANMANTNTTHLKNDIVALAIEAQQAKVLIPAWQVYLLGIVITAVLTFPYISDAMFELIGQFTRPSVRFVD